MKTSPSRIIVLTLLLLFIKANVSSLSLGEDFPRRNFLSKTLVLSSSVVPWFLSFKECHATTTNEPPMVSLPSRSSYSTMSMNSGFRYSSSWTGTLLPLLTLEQSSQLESWNFGRWPDPILRRPATAVSPSMFGTSVLLTACRLLEETAHREKAVGLAAQQCGVDARLVFVEHYGTLVNPRIVARSPETQMKVWQEECLVLPPSFVATVLRDDWVDVEYWTPKDGQHSKLRLNGEASRCLQHEMDHDRGILVLDHVGLEEMENDIMRGIEQTGHDSRMILAYNRQIEEPAIV